MFEYTGAIIYIGIRESGKNGPKLSERWILEKERTCHVVGKIDRSVLLNSMNSQSSIFYPTPSHAYQQTCNIPIFVWTLPFPYVNPK